MQKFITITFAIATFLTSTLAIQANPTTVSLTANSTNEVTSKKRKVKRTYYRTKYVKRNGRIYEETYKVTEFYSGASKYSLTSSRHVKRGLFGSRNGFNSRFSDSGVFHRSNRFKSKRFRKFSRKRTSRYKNKYFVNKRF